MSQNTKPASSSPKQIINVYAACFHARLDTLEVWEQLKARCERRRENALIDAYRGVVNYDVPDEEVGPLFLDFLKSDDLPADFVTRLHSKRLAAFDQAKSLLAGEVKEAGRKMLEAEYALWQNHRQVLTAGSKDRRVFNEIDRNGTYAKLMRRPGAFQLHEALVFSSIWEKVIPGNKF